MVLSKDVDEYINEAHNIYDLVGNCFGMMCEKVKDQTAFIRDYVSEGERNSSNPNLPMLNRFFEKVMDAVISYRPSRYQEFAKRVRGWIQELELREYLKREENELTVIFFLLSGIDAGARLWEMKKLSSAAGPLDRDNKTGYRVYFTSNYTLHDDYIDHVGRDRMNCSDFASAFRTFRFINTKDWKLGENIPRIIYIPKNRGEMDKRGTILKVAAIPGMDECNFQFQPTYGSGCKVVYTLTEQETIKKKIQNSLRKALEARCDIIVFPEYVASPEVYGMIRDQVKNFSLNVSAENRPRLIFSGSTWTEDDNNVLNILDAWGDEIGKYYKYSAFTKRKKNGIGYEICESLANPGKYCDLVALEGMGLFLPALCRDVIDGKYTEEIVRALLPFFVVISAWSKSVKSFVPRQKELANKYFISSILVNGCSAVRKDRISIGNACIIHKNNTIAGASIEDICRDNCREECKNSECVYIAEYDFEFNDSKKTAVKVYKL